MQLAQVDRETQTGFPGTLTYPTSTSGHRFKLQYEYDFGALTMPPRASIPAHTQKPPTDEVKAAPAGLLFHRRALVDSVRALVALLLTLLAFRALCP
jgi:hypothetical protein